MLDHLFLICSVSVLCHPGGHPQLLVGETPPVPPVRALYDGSGPVLLLREPSRLRSLLCGRQDLGGTPLPDTLFSPQPRSSASSVPPLEQDRGPFQGLVPRPRLVHPERSLDHGGRPVHLSQPSPHQPTSDPGLDFDGRLS